MMPLVCTPNLGWLALAIPIALLSLFVSVLLGMLAKFFGMQNLTMWTHAEYAQVAVSFLLIAFAVGMQTAGCSVVGEVALKVAAASANVNLINAAGGSVADPAQIAKSYILSLVDCADWVWKGAWVLNSFFEVVSSMSLDVRGAEGIGGSLAFQGKVTLMHYIANNMVYLAVLNFVMYHLLSFSQYTMLPIFLPIGLLLRSFPLTRGAGGLVTAFALGFAFVFPMTFVLITAMMPHSGFVCKQVEAQVTSNQFAGFEQCTENIGNQIGLLSEVRGNADELDAATDTLQKVIGVFYLQSVVYPVVCLIITFTFIRQTGSLFGADLAEIGRGLVKII